jgi:outer membrane immunogenic protein
MVASYLILPLMWHFGDSLPDRFRLYPHVRARAVALAVKGREVKKILLTTTALIALGVAPAAAADLAARPYTKAPAAIAMYNWSGFYAGVNGGWGSSHNGWEEVFGAAAVSLGSHDATGGTVGGQIGYRWQAASWVFGVEAQGNWADFQGSNVIPLAPVFINDTRVEAFGLLTGQVGYAANNVLFYAKGGAAVTSDRYRLLATATGLSAAVNNVDDTRWGGVVGVGLEYGFAPNWSAGIEYNHMFMQDKTYSFVSNGSFVPAGLVTQVRIGQDVDIVTARINYRFGGPAAARY